MFTYIGAYDQVGAAYDKIYGERLNGFQTRADYCMERYVSDPSQTPPDQSVTEIYIPIE